MPAYCIHCHKPADRRCGNVLELADGNRLHRSCLTPHLLMIVKSIPEPEKPAPESFGAWPAEPAADPFDHDDAPSDL